jgi:hypothetical protein
LLKRGADAADDLDIEPYFSAFIQRPDLPCFGQAAIMADDGAKNV